MHVFVSLHFIGYQPQWNVAMDRGWTHSRFKLPCAALKPHYHT